MPTPAGTQAERILAVSELLVRGEIPAMRDVMAIRSSILRSDDIYAPDNMGTQLRGANLDVSGCGCMGGEGGAVGHQPNSMGTNLAVSLCVCGGGGGAPGGTNHTAWAPTWS